MSHIFPASLPISWSIDGTDSTFPVRRIYCVGQNYEEHAREMGHEKASPFFFSKPADALVENHSKIKYPTMTSNFHHEIELVVAIGKSGSEILPENADDHIYGFALGIDLTRRDLQAAAKKLGKPWDVAKGFDHSAPMTKIYPKSNNKIINVIDDINNISLYVNNEIRQSSSLDKMIWNISDLISILSNYYELKAGDLIFTGTPAGVGPLVKGDKIIGKSGFIEDLHIEII